MLGKFSDFLSRIQSDKPNDITGLSDLSKCKPSHSSTPYDPNCIEDQQTKFVPQHLDVSINFIY